MGKAATIKDVNRSKPTNSRLTAIRFIKNACIPSLNFHNGRKKNKTAVECLCNCGKIILVYFDNLNKTKFSCGCTSKRKKLSPEEYKIKRTIYMLYRGIIRRCYYTEDNAYKYYGSRGVKVCYEWRHNYKRFYKWCMENGWEKGLQLDKDIKGNGKLYSPNKCLFVTPEENLRIRSNVKLILFNGEMLTIPEISRKVNCNYGKLFRKLKRGFSLEMAIEMSA